VPKSAAAQTMGDRLRELMGDLSYEAFGELAGVSAQAVQKWLNGGNITDRSLERLLRHEPYRSRGVTKEWVRYGATPSVAGAAPGKYLFPRAYENVIAGLGTGRFNEDYTIEVAGTIAVPANLIRARGWRIERLAVVQTDGRSMEPTLNEDEPVVVNLDETKILNNKIYAIEDADEGLRIKRLSKQRDGRVLVRSDNADKFTYPDDYITPESSTRIVGRVCFRSGEV
jgi:phage repressor protein C with HTH and peptisase S24 domain